VKMMVRRPVMRVAVAESHSGERKRGRTGCRKIGRGRLVFGQLLFDFSPPQGHEIHPYL